MNITMLAELPRFVQHFIEELQKESKKDTTIKRYAYDLLDFLAWLQVEKGDKEFETWQKLELDDYKEFFSMLQHERKCSKRTLHRFRTVLNQLAKYYANKGHSVELPGEIVLGSLMKEFALTKDDFITQEELVKLKRSVISPVGLSEKQLLSRPFLINRNLSIITLFVDYGLTMHELSELTRKDVNLVRNTINITKHEYERELELEQKDALLLNSYLQNIPKPVRPKLYEKDPFFVAFDYYRGTYHWNYEEERPKQLTEVAIQKMIRGEIKKAKFSRQITARNLRNTSILNSILKQKSKSELYHQFGIKTERYLIRFLQYACKINPSLKEYYFGTEVSS